MEPTKGSYRRLSAATAKQLGDHGIVSVFVVYDHRKRKLIKSPDIICRGLVNVKQSPQLMQAIRDEVKKTVDVYFAKHKIIEQRKLKITIIKNVERTVMKKTGKEPIITAVVAPSHTIQRTNRKPRTLGTTRLGKTSKQ